MELHDMAQYRLPRTRRLSYLAFSEDRRPRNVADDEQACRRGTRALGLGCIPAARAVAQTLASGSSAAATNRSFSAALQRRRRCTDVMTSIAVLLM
jgi:hypothetical protein